MDDFIEVGPEAFADKDAKVISWKGANYYLMCDVWVSNLKGGGQTFCVKRHGHPGNVHEDYDGRIRIISPTA